MTSAIVPDLTSEADPRTWVDSTAATGERHSSTRWKGGQTNWIWLAPAGRRACALVIGDITASYQRGLAVHFERVERIPVRALQPIATVTEAGTTMTPSHLSFRTGSVDCVISTDLISSWLGRGTPPGRDHRFIAVLAELRRVLRPGGFLFLSGRNARCHKVWLRPVTTASTTGGAGSCGYPLDLRAMQHALASAGFSEARPYLAEELTGDLLTMLPASRQAALVYEQRERLPDASAPIRKLLALAGLYELLYPDAFVIAIR